jgi:hypothetical protein
MRAGLNPARRNRNIGTAKQGHGQDNAMVVPAFGADGRRWAERLGPHRLFQRSVAGREVIFVVEETSAGFSHACTVEDIRHVLANIPFADWEGLNTFVLRQSTRKQRVLHPVWGRLFYSADLGLPGRKTVRLGPALMLEALDDNAKITWSTSLNPHGLAELERLRTDGHEVSRSGRRLQISMTPASIRATQLYRTLLHEIGHWVDYLEKVLRPAGDDDARWSELTTAYFARPQDEREAFAHRYADTTRERLIKFGVLPFAPKPYLTRQPRPTHSDDG